MKWQLGLGFGLAAVLGGSAAGQAQQSLPAPATPNLGARATPLMVAQEPGRPGIGEAATEAPLGGAIGSPGVGDEGGGVEGRTNQPSPYGPTPLAKVGTLQELIFGDRANDVKTKIAAWADFDYTFRSTGPGVNNIAPVMNRFGDEFLVRTLGIYISRGLDKDWSWGYNVIFIGGADAFFLQPIGGGWTQTNPRFGSSFTDLNFTFHMPILTEGGVDVKAGRQTTVLGPMGALPWQRWFDSSDYAWYDLEEGRYTGVSAVWHVNKRFDWYNGIEFGWGNFFDYYSPAPQYIGQMSYWLDEEAKDTKTWVTCVTGPTGMINTGNTTITEWGIQHNWNEYVYQILDTQLLYSKAPIFQSVPKGYQQRSYDVYTYLGRHLTKELDLNSRFEYFYDADGGFYPGGFGGAGGQPKTSYFEMTVGVDYHPCKNVQFRPEIRYDHATNPAFGAENTQENQLSMAAEVLFKF